MKCKRSVHFATELSLSLSLGIKSNAVGIWAGLAWPDLARSDWAVNAPTKLALLYQICLHKKTDIRGQLCPRWGLCWVTTDKKGCPFKGSSRTISALWVPHLVLPLRCYLMSGWVGWLGWGPPNHCTVADATWQVLVN